MTDPAVAVNMQAGQRLLIRYICAGYYPQRIRFGGVTAEVVASDGRPFPQLVQVQSLEAASAERYDCIIQPDRAGVYEVEVDVLHWVTNQVLGTARTRITVT